MKKILLCVLILLVSVNVFAADVDINQLTKAATQGDVTSQIKLGEMYLSGKGVAQDYEMALKWYLEAAEQNNRDAQFQVGEMYYAGAGTIQSYSAAFKYYEKAAIQGHSGAQHMLGVMYDLGQNTPKNEEKAFEWYGKAAEGQNFYAQVMLGEMYYFGRGVSQDVKLGYMWIFIALATTEDQEQASILRGALDEFSTTMTTQEITNAQQIAVEWLEKHK